jgi:hypothetical protein
MEPINLREFSQSDGNRIYRYGGPRRRRSETYFEDLPNRAPYQVRQAYDTMVDKIKFRLAALSKEFTGIDEVIREFRMGRIGEDEMMLAFDVFDNDYTYILYLMDKVEDICGEHGMPCPRDFPDIRADIQVKNDRVREILRMF